MRYIDINSIENLDELQLRLKECKDWGCVRSILADLSKKTCWYCEHYVPATGYAEVDHWRPKSQKMYPWLEFEIKNYIYSCKCCNNKKLDKFPLKDDTKRAKSPTDDISKEEPLLLNPLNKSDIQSICYDMSGRLVPKKNEIRDKVRKTKEILQLDTTDRLAEKSKAFSVLCSDLDTYLQFKSNEEFANVMIKKINEKIKYEEGNPFVWSFCMYIESWFKENDTKLVGTNIREKIKFPEDFKEVYLNN